MGKGLFDVHIICSQTDGLVSYYSVVYCQRDSITNNIKLAAFSI